MKEDTAKAKSFWACVHIRGEDECWPWLLGTYSNGYGAMGYKFEGSKSTHRAAWIHANGSIPQGLYVLHRCDNRPCCNPKHLFLGTTLVNNRDAIAKGRAAYQVGTANLPKGEAALPAKLTNDQAKEIRNKYASGTPVKQLSIIYNIGGSSIYKILKGDRYKI